MLDYIRELDWATILVTVAFVSLIVIKAVSYIESYLTNIQDKLESLEVEINDLTLRLNRKDRDS